jgi:hypothetical protein
MGVNNSTFDPKNPRHALNKTAQMQLAMMGYAPEPGFRNDADGVQWEQYKKYYADTHNGQVPAAQTPETLARMVEEAFLRDARGQAKLRELTLRAGDASQSLSTDESFALQAGLRASGYTLPLNGDSKDPIMRNIATLVASRDGQQVAATPRADIRQFQQQLKGLGVEIRTDGGFDGDTMMAVGDFMHSVSRLDPEGYKKLTEQLGHSSVTLSDLQSPDRFALIKAELDKVSADKDAATQALAASTWPAKMDQRGSLSARVSGPFSQFGGNGFDYKVGEGPTVNIGGPNDPSYMQGLPKPDLGVSHISDGVGGMKEGPLRYVLR